MKKTILIIVLTVAVIGLFVYSYQYRNNKIEQQDYSISSSIADSTDTEQTTTEKSEKRVLVAEDKDNDYQIYYDGANVDIVHGEYTRTFTSWSYAMECENPTIYCKDYDGDGEKELLLRVVNGKLETQYDKNASPYTYALYLFKPVTTGTGEKTFTALTASADTWKTPFASAINCELTQLKNCNKFLQFTMDDADTAIEYNEKSGITTNKHVGYAMALCDSSKKYYTLSRWNRGVGIYNFDKNGNITLDIQVLVNYEEITDTQYIGDIHCEMNVSDGKFGITPKTIVFNPIEKYSLTDPRDLAKVKWNCVINNESTNTNFKNTEIDWIEAEFSLTNTSDQNSQYFETMPSKIKCVDTVKFTQGAVTLTAKDGYSFSEPIAESNRFSVIIHNGEKDEYDISYTCSVNNKDGKSTLTIKFDKTYDKEDFDKVLINFGV